MRSCEFHNFANIVTGSAPRGHPGDTKRYLQIKPKVKQGVKNKSLRHSIVDVGYVWMLEVLVYALVTICCERKQFK